MCDSRDQYRPSDSTTTEVSRWDLLLKFNSRVQRMALVVPISSIWYWIGLIVSRALDWWCTERSAHVYCVSRRDPQSGENIIWQCSGRYSTFITHYFSQHLPLQRTLWEPVSVSQSDSDHRVIDWSLRLLIEMVVARRHFPLGFNLTLHFNTFSSI